MKNDKLSHITGDAVKTALVGFTLKLTLDWNYELLATEVRRALSGTMLLSKDLDPARLSNTEIKNKLTKISRAANSLHKDILSLDYHSDNRLIDTSFKNDGNGNFIGFIFSYNTGYKKFHSLVSQLNFLESFLQAAAQNIEKQSHKWRDREKRSIRIFQAEALIFIFTEAFGENPTVNNAQTTDEWQNPTPFMVFYQRIVTLAFREKGTPNLVEVLKTAQKNYKENVAVRASRSSE